MWWVKNENLNKKTPKLWLLVNRPCRCQDSCGKSLEQDRRFRYLGSDISYDQDHNVDNELHKCHMICGTVGRTLQNNVQREAKMKFYRMMAAPLFLHWNQVWKTTRSWGASEVRFLPQIVECTRLHHIGNQKIMYELGVCSTNDKLIICGRKQKERLDRVPEARLRN